MSTVFAFDQSLAGSYHAAELRAQAQRDSQAKLASPHPLRELVRRLAR